MSAAINILGEIVSLSLDQALVFGNILKIIRVAG
jgi:hypothetical protein